MQKWIKNGLLLALLCVLPGGMADAEEIQQIGQGHFTGTISHDLEGNIVLDFTDIQLTLPSGWSGKCAIKAGEDNVTFYQKGSYDLWAQEGAADGGRLFEISMQIIWICRLMRALEPRQKGIITWNILQILAATPAMKTLWQNFSRCRME